MKVVSLFSMLKKNSFYASTCGFFKEGGYYTLDVTATLGYSILLSHLTLLRPYICIKLKHRKVMLQSDRYWSDGKEFRMNLISVKLSSNPFGSFESFASFNQNVKSHV